MPADTFAECVSINRDAARVNLRRPIDAAFKRIKVTIMAVSLIANIT